jgi:hypothetical protein
MRFLTLSLCLLLVFQSIGWGADCSNALSTLRDEMPQAIHDLDIETLRDQVKVEFKKEADEIQINFGDRIWNLKLIELVQAYESLMEIRQDRLPQLWENTKLGTQQLRAEFDYWVKKLYLQGKLNLEPSRFHRIRFMLSHREFWPSAASIIFLPLITWYAGHSIHFSFVDQWNKFESTFLHVNAGSRTFGNLIRMDEIHYHNPKRSMIRLFWLVILVSMTSQALGTVITGFAGDPVFPRIDRALVIALAVIFYDIPISRMVHRFQFSSRLSKISQNISAKDLQRSQIMAEIGIQSFLKVNGAFVLQLLIYLSNRLYDLGSGGL